MKNDLKDKVAEIIIDQNGIPRMPNFVDSSRNAISSDDETTRLNRNLAEIIQNLNGTRSLTPQSALYYDSQQGLLLFNGKEIHIPANTDLEEVCKKIFKNPTAKRWTWEQVFKDDDITANRQQKLYTASRGINTKVAKETTVKDLLIVKMKFTQINPKYL